MTTAAALAVVAVALAAVVIAAVVAHRRGGLRVDVRVWWGNGRDPPDQ